MRKREFPSIEYCPFCGERVEQPDEFFEEEYECPDCGDIQIEFTARWREMTDEEIEERDDSPATITFKGLADEKLERLLERKTD